MDESAQEESALHFGVFDLDLETGELRKSGVLLHLPPQPFKILSLLASHPSQLVTREEIQQQIWGSETFVDFEQGLNFAIKKIRDALGDDAETPRYIETLPRRGYRFIAAVETARRAVSNGETLPRNVSAAPETAGAQEGSPPPTASTPQQITTGGYTRRAVTALAQGVEEEHRARLRWRRMAALGLGLAGVVVGLAGLMSLNVGGLRERVLTLVGARHGVPLPKIESLAVLPLENLSRDPEQEYFADGMTEELIANLGKVGALRVISRQSVMRYKRSEKPLPEIARELNVDAVVEGAVARSGGRVRITAQLIQANPEKNLWAETYERDLRDVLALQGEVARAIVQEIRVKLTPQEQVHLATTRPLNPEAHEAYLMGRYFWNKRTEEGFSKSIECFQRAIQKEPDYALAYAGLADSYVVLGSFGFRSPQEVMPKGKAAALKALAIDETLAEAHASLAMLKIDYEYDWLEAEREFQRAIELNPGYASAHQWYSQYLMARGRTAESLAENQRALDLDPLSPIMNSIYGWHLYFAGHDDEAIAQLRKTLEVNPDFPPAYFYLGLPYEHKGIYKEAIAKFEKALQLSGGGPIYVSALGHALGVAGRRTAAQRYLVVLEDLSRRSYVSPYDFAVVHAGLDHKDLVIAWLGKAYEDHSFRLIYLKVDPMFDPLRSDPRFQDLLRRMNFPP